MPRTAYSPPHRPYLFTPDGWDDGWVAAKAAAHQAPQTIAFLGDSVQNGFNCSDWTKAYPRRLKAALAALGLPTAAEYYPAYGLSPLPGQLTVGTPPFSAALNGAAGGNAGGYGWHTHYTWSAVAANPYQRFTSPFACTAMDILYNDYFNGSWQYSVDGAASVPVSNPWQGNNAAGAQIRRISLSGLPNQVHTIDFGWQSAGNAMFILGVVCYVPAVAGGLRYAYLHCGGDQAGQAWPTIFGGAAPMLLGGQKTQCQTPTVTHPTANPTAAAGAAGALTGTFFWAVTFIGNGGETAIGNASNAAVLNAQQASLTNVPTGGNGTFHRNVYRATTAGGPWQLVGTIPDNATTTFTDDNAAPGAAPPAADPDVSPTGFGFPLGAQLAIVEFGLNECNAAVTAATFQNNLRQVVEGLRRAAAPAGPATSLIIHAMMNADNNTTDSQGFTPANWYQYLDVLRSVAQDYNCAFLNTHASWTARFGGQLNTQTPGSPGYLSNQQSHPTDAGHQDIADTIMSIL